MAEESNLAWCPTPRTTISWACCFRGHRIACLCIDTYARTVLQQCKANDMHNGISSLLNMSALAEWICLKSKDRRSRLDARTWHAPSLHPYPTPRPEQSSAAEHATWCEIKQGSSDFQKTAQMNTNLHRCITRLIEMCCLPPNWIGRWAGPYRQRHVVTGRV